MRPTPTNTNTNKQKLPCQRHRYHRECVGRHVAYALEKRDCPVPCVVEGCGAKMMEAQVRVDIVGFGFDVSRLTPYVLFVWSLHN